MTPTYRAILAAALLAGPAIASAQASPRITTAEIDGHLRFLSSDLLDGRAPATRGGRITAEYNASQLRAAGVEPGVNGSYVQDGPIDVVGADVSSITMTASGKATSTLRSPQDVVVFYRSDHFSFAKAHRYHQPSDAYRPDFDLAGAVQLATIVHRFGTQLPNSPSVPTWNKDAEFRSPRVATQP